MSYMDNYNLWLNSDYIDQKTKDELKAISDNPKEIEERFYKNLEFGTGGLRGIIGAGTNRMNIYTIRNATQGLANYILKQGEQAKSMGVAIAHDPRYMSPEFCEQAALVLNGNGIKTYVFDELRPTPVLSFAVRHLGCIAGVVITASHNPKEYNGYKAYWSDGGQIPYPKDEEIIDEVNAIEEFSQIKLADKQEAINAGLYNVIESSFDDEYIKNVKAQSINPEIIEKASDTMKIVYTPLNGAGNKPIRRVLNEVGFKNVYVVPEQELPDPNFATIGYPNPEDPKAFTLALKLADQLSADVIIASDPDADRLGTVVKNSNGEYSVLTGNMIGALISEYMLSQKKELGKLPKNGALISTIVSTNLAAEIAKAYGIEFIEVLTGFKYIGEKIKEFEQTGSNEFIFGFEESYGYLAGTYARDKDACVAAMLVSELAAFYKTRGLSLYEGLQEIYKKYGYFKESVESISLTGIEGIESIKKIMETLRVNPPKEVSGLKITKVRDYQKSITKDVNTGSEEKITLPVSNVLYFELEDESWFCVRPSGTEPKIKIYFGVKGTSHEDSESKVAKLSKGVMEVVNNAM